MKKPFLILALYLFLPAIFVQAQTSTSLDGVWTFALDPLKAGEELGWNKHNFSTSGFDKVTVPHCYSADGRYLNYTGDAWYFKSIDFSSTGNDQHVFLQFDAVFYQCTIWVNGKMMGEHEGGYTPFEFDITKVLNNGKNLVTVRISNAWSTATIPGAKTFDTSYRQNASQLYAWMNYGGITRSCRLITRPAVYAKNVQVTAAPDLKTGKSKVTITGLLVNTSDAAVNREVVAELKKGTVAVKSGKAIVQQLAANSSKSFNLVMLLEAKQTELWSLNNPVLYQAIVSTEGFRTTSRFGIRSIKVEGTRLLLNGRPIKLGGANRPTDFPGLGSVEPDSVVDKDLRLMREGGMIFSRIAHHAVSEKVLNWCDENGMLIITEAGNWQMTPQQMNDTQMRSKYRSQVKEMIERDFNHPSVIAYSLGNEFYSQKAEGKSWVKDMRDYTRSLDSTRLITFASYMVFRDFVKQREDEASQYVDFISANLYGNQSPTLDHIHAVYPDKPIYISEFGTRLTKNKTAQQQTDYFKKAFDAIRDRDYVIGASVWSFNDYQSRYPETDEDGYRRWGLVDAFRSPRPVYYAVAELLNPFIIEQGKSGSAGIVVTARTNFPVIEEGQYSIKLNGVEKLQRIIRPGEKVVVPLADIEADIEVVITNAKGFVVGKQTIKAN